MSASPNPSDVWIPCPPGTLGQYARLEKTRQRRKFLAKASGVAVLLAAGGSVGIRALAPLLEKEPKFNGVTCSEFRGQFQALNAGTLPADVTALLRGHLDRCETCREFVRKLDAASKNKPIS